MELFSLNREELREYFKGIGEREYRADQLLNWIYKKGVWDFERMTNLPKELRNRLKKEFKLFPLKILERLRSEDSVKYLFETQDGHLLETVLIKERDHYTLCLSTQIGCAIGCKFCATAIDGLLRNLKVEEIVSQYLLVWKDLKVRPRNLVFMGMGEPLANYENLRKSVEIFISPWGLDLSKRRVSVSTSGLIRQIERMAKDPLLRELNLAVSINAPNQEKRLKIMPLSQTNPLKELMKVLIGYPLPKNRRITLEYVLIRDFNDSREDAKELARLIGKHKRRFKVNLIPYNPEPNLPFKRPSLERILEFQRALWEEGIATFVRFSKGLKVFGACGQLRYRRLSAIIK